MPDYSTLLRTSSQAPSTHTQESIRRRSGAHRTIPSPPTVSTDSRQTAGYQPQDVPQSAVTGHSNGRATALSPSGASHFTAIPTRSRRSSIISSRPGLRSGTSRRAASAKVDHDSELFIVPLDTNDDTTTPSGAFQAAPVAASSASYFSRISANVQTSAKQLSSLARNGLLTLHRKFVSESLSNARLPTFNSNKPPSPQRRFGLDRALSGASAKGFLSTADKMTHRWPRPRSSRSIPPGLRPLIITSSFSTGRRLRQLKGAGGWSQDSMEAILRDSRGLGVNWVGQWTLHKWCLLASVTTVFLLGLTCLVFSLLTWFAGESAGHFPVQL